MDSFEKILNMVVSMKIKYGTKTIYLDTLEPVWELYSLAIDNGITVGEVSKD